GRRRVEGAFTLAGTTGELLAVLDRHNPPPEVEAAALAAAGVVAIGGGEGWLADAGLGGEPPIPPAANGPTRGASVVGLRRFHRGLDAAVAEVLVPAAGEAPALRVVKRHLDRPGASRPAVERARREAAVAARVAAWDGAPRPLGLDEERAIVVFAPCPGEPLDALVRRLRFRRDDERLAAAVGAAGRWLARYQATPLADLFDAVARAAPLADRTGGGSQRGNGPPPVDDPSPDLRGVAAIEPGLRRRLDRLRERARPESLGPVPVHGDLWPGNLLVDGATARALDYEGADLGPRYADAAWFLLHLDLYLARPGLGRRRRALEEAFLAGWLGDAAAADRAALALLRAEAAVLLLRRSARGGGPRSRWRRRLLRHELARAAAEGAR
ncbi:MAG TPA: phosphotransferase, partial [Thermoanaerobaculia bacterium]